MAVLILQRKPAVIVLTACMTMGLSLNMRPRLHLATNAASHRHCTGMRSLCPQSDPCQILAVTMKQKK